MSSIQSAKLKCSGTFSCNREQSQEFNFIKINEIDWGVNEFFILYESGKKAKKGIEKFHFSQCDIEVDVLTHPLLTFMLKPSAMKVSEKKNYEVCIFQKRSYRNRSVFASEGIQKWKDVEILRFCRHPV